MYHCIQCSYIYSLSVNSIHVLLWNEVSVTMFKLLLSTSTSRPHHHHFLPEQSTRNVPLGCTEMCSLLASNHRGVINFGSVSTLAHFCVTLSKAVLSLHGMTHNYIQGAKYVEVVV